MSVFFATHFILFVSLFFVMMPCGVGIDRISSGSLILQNLVLQVGCLNPERLKELVDFGFFGGRYSDPPELFQTHFLGKPLLGKLFICVRSGLKSYPHANAVASVDQTVDQVEKIYHPLIA